MLQNKKILFIGFGKMGQAIARNMLEKNGWAEENIFVVDPYFKPRSFKYKINSFLAVTDISTKFDACIIAIKPQQFDEVLPQYKNFPKSTLFISIAAGKKISTIKKLIGEDKQVVRLMPNLPIEVSEGMVGVYFNKEISDKNIKLVNHIFSKSGEFCGVNTENTLNKITATSGSGPGFVFNMLEIFAKAAIKIGMSEDVANKLAFQTFKGAIALAEASDKSFTELKNDVASKGGTTEAGLEVLNKNNALENLFSDAIEAAYNKAKELSD